MLSLHVLEQKWLFYTYCIHSVKRKDTIWINTVFYIYGHRLSQMQVVLLFLSVSTCQHLHTQIRHRHTLLYTYTHSKMKGSSWCVNTRHPCMLSPIGRLCSIKQRFSANWAGYVLFLHICTLSGVCLSFFLGLSTTCDLWVWFMWFFRSTYISCQSFLHALAHHTGKKIGCWVRLQQNKRHFRCLCSQSQVVIKLSHKATLWIFFPFRQEA